MKVYAVVFNSLFYRSEDGRLVTFATRLVDARLWSEDGYKDAAAVASKVRGKVVAFKLSPWEKEE